MDHRVLWSVKTTDDKTRSSVPRRETLVRLAKQTIKRGASVAGVTRNLRGGVGLDSRWRSRVRGVACDRDSRLEQSAVVGLVLHRNSYRDGLQALEPRGGFKMRALFAAMQRHSALGTISPKVDVGRQRRGTTEATGRRDRLY
jgi:hypothetical protein